MFEQLRASFRTTLGRGPDAAEEARRARRDRAPRVESLEGRVLCDGDVLQNTGTVATITFGPGS